MKLGIYNVIRYGQVTEILGRNTIMIGNKVRMRS